MEKENFIIKMEKQSQFKNGDKFGKCKEYHSNGELYFEGEYIRGEKSGYCKLYDTNDKLNFESEFLNGKKMGQEKNIM